jgi:hypothetical protein
LLAVYRLLSLEFESGDAFPRFSSYRPDPLGLLVLHEALASLPGPAPQRNLLPADTADFPEGATLLFAGASVGRDTVKTLEHLERFVDGGGRLVIAFRPDVHVPEGYPNPPKKQTADSDESGQDSDSSEESSDENVQEDSSRDEMMEALMPREDIAERWGFGYDMKDVDNGRESAIPVGSAETVATLPSTLPWHSKLVFKDLSPEWTAVYQRDGSPVVIERPWGAGTIVLSADNYTLTNEAMRRQREAGYVAWLVGTDQPVVFEETHLGVAKPIGIMALIKRYRLVPVLLAAIFIVALHVWRNAASLIPKSSGAVNEAAAVPAFTTVAGMANIVRRSVSPADLPETCWTRFDAPLLSQRPLSTAERRRVQEVLEDYQATPRRKRNAANAYNQIQSIVNERSPHS